MPPRGPPTPVSSPTLLLVTQNQHLHVCYYRSYVSSLKIMSCSLACPEVNSERRPLLGHDISSGLGGVKLCVNAAIGLGYNGNNVNTHINLYFTLIYMIINRFSYTRSYAISPFTFPHCEADHIQSYGLESSSSC